MIREWSNIPRYLVSPTYIQLGLQPHYKQNPNRITVMNIQAELWMVLKKKWFSDSQTSYHSGIHTNIRVGSSFDNLFVPHRPPSLPSIMLAKKPTVTSQGKDSYRCSRCGGSPRISQYELVEKGDTSLTGSIIMFLYYIFSVPFTVRKHPTSVIRRF